MYATGVQRAAWRWSGCARRPRPARVSQTGVHAQNDEGMRVLSPASRLQPERRREVLRRARSLAQRLHGAEAPTVALALDLKRIPQRELHRARLSKRAGGRTCRADVNLSEIRIVDGGDGVREIDHVEQVECLDANFDLMAPHDVEHSRHGQIELHAGW